LRVAGPGRRAGAVWNGLLSTCNRNGFRFDLEDRQRWSDAIFGMSGHGVALAFFLDQQPGAKKVSRDFPDENIEIDDFVLFALEPVSAFHASRPDGDILTWRRFLPAAVVAMRVEMG